MIHSLIIILQLGNHIGLIKESKRVLVNTLIKIVNIVGIKLVSYIGKFGMVKMES